MNRRAALTQLLGIAGGSLASSWIHAAVSGLALHVAPPRSRLSAAQRAMIAPLAELIIPRTDTPGAIEAGVPAFIDRIVSDWYTDREREIFISGITGLEAFCLQRYGRGFVECGTAERAAALREAQEQAVRYAPPPSAGILSVPEEHSPFFFKVKQLTVIGYYTSEVGATEELAYNPVPGHYEGDYDFAAIGRQWSY